MKKSELNQWIARFSSMSLHTLANLYLDCFDNFLMDKVAVGCEDLRDAILRYITTYRNDLVPFAQLVEKYSQQR